MGDHEVSRRIVMEFGGSGGAKRLHLEGMDSQSKLHIIILCKLIEIQITAKFNPVLRESMPWDYGHV